MSSPAVQQPTAPVSTAPTLEAQTPVEQPVAEPKYKVKIDGKTVEVTLDELKNAYSLDQATRKRFQEANQKLKEAENLRSVYSQRDINKLKEAGWTDDEIEERAADFLINRAKQKSMTPEQRAQAEREEEYKRLKEAEDARLAAEKKKAKDSIEQREAQLYQSAFFSDIAKADKQTWLDLNDPIILSHVIRDVASALTNDGYDMPVIEAVRSLEKRMEKRGAPKKEYLKKLSKLSIKDIDDSELDAFLEKGAKGIREKSVEAIKRAESPFAKINTQIKSDQTPPNTTKKHDAQYYRNLRLGRTQK